jgi:Ca-activated chloride channel homolog
MSVRHGLAVTAALAFGLAGCSVDGDKKQQTQAQPPAVGPPVAQNEAPVSPAPMPMDAAGVAADASAPGGYASSPPVMARMKQAAADDMPPPVAISEQEPEEKIDSRYGWYPVPMTPAQSEKYAAEKEGKAKLVAIEPVSTFAVDVDTGSYANMRRYLNKGQLPPADSVRVEEWLNYFHYNYPQPADKAVPFSVSTEVAKTPWNKKSYLLKVGLQGYDVARSERPAANLVFLLDISGSMNEPDKLPLMIAGMKMLTEALTPNDRVAIVTYAGETGVALASTRVDVNGRARIRKVLDSLGAGGSTAGEAGLTLAYKQAQAGFVRGGINRIILATDGDFNVGVSDQKELESIIETKRKSGITLSTLGFGEGNYREDIMERIADIGNGNYAYIDSASEAQKVLVEELASTLFTIAQDVKIQIEFNPDVIGEYRLIGYENRALAREDFNDDKKDAGDIGAGHTVTAIYEITPLADTERKVDDLRYGKNPAKAMPKTPRPSEVAFLRLRYKLPGEARSKLIEQPLPTAALDAATAPKGDLAFAAAVAAFGQTMKGSAYLGTYKLADIAALAGEGAKGDTSRSEFVRLVGIAKALKPEVATR